MRNSSGGLDHSPVLKPVHLILLLTLATFRQIQPLKVKEGIRFGQFPVS